MPAAAPLLFTDPRSGVLRKRRWRLRVVDGPDLGREADLDRSPAMIGAAPAAALVLTDDTVSRYHLEVDLFADGLRIRDLDSTNGTFVGSSRVKDAFVEPSETFRIGRTSVLAIGLEEALAHEVETDPHGVPLGGVENVAGAIAASTEMRSVLHTVKKVARAPSPVVIEGEEGTGRATCARIIHELSPRKREPLVFVRFRRGVTAQDAEEELFGRPDAREGPFEKAHGGTLVLEQIDRLPSAAQPRLLRALETGDLPKSADARRRRIDVRVVSTTSRPLAQVEEFSAALRRRLEVVRVRVPPLRERRGDVVPLARHFAKALGIGGEIGARLAAALEGRPWTGNLDELRAALEQVFAQDALAAALADPAAPRPNGASTELRAARVADLVADRRGDVTAAARSLSVGTRDLFRYLSVHAIDLDAM